MGRFTEEMRRLRESANRAQQERNQLIQDLNKFKSNLTHEVEHFLADQQTTRLTQAAEDRANRQEFISQLATEIKQHCDTFRQNLTHSVNELREQHHAEQQQRQQDLVEMAEREQTARHDFVSNLQTTIAQMREELTSDRAEASQIWFEMRAPSIHAGGEILQSAPPSTLPHSSNQVTYKTQEEEMRDSSNFVSGFKTTVSNLMRDFRDEGNTDPPTTPSKSDS